MARNSTLNRECDREKHELLPLFNTKACFLTSTYGALRESNSSRETRALTPSAAARTLIKMSFVEAIYMLYNKIITEDRPMSKHYNIAIDTCHMI